MNYKRIAIVLFSAVFCMSTVSLALNCRSLYTIVFEYPLYSADLLFCDFFFIFLSFNAILYLSFPQINEMKWFKYAFLLIGIPQMLIFITIAICFLSHYGNPHMYSRGIKDFLNCFMSDLVINTILFPFATGMLFASEVKPDRHILEEQKEGSKAPLITDPNKQPQSKFQKLYKIIVTVMLFGAAGVSMTLYWILYLDYEGNILLEWTIVACNGVFIFCSIGTLLTIWFKKLLVLDWPRYFYVIFVFPMVGINFVICVVYLYFFWEYNYREKVKMVISQQIILSILLPIAGILRWKITPENENAIDAKIPVVEDAEKKLNG